MMKKVLFSCIAIALLGIASSSYAKGFAADGKEKSEVCAACHGTDGNGNPDNPLWPKIAGQHEGYALKQLRAFTKGEEGPRFNAAMIGVLQGLADKDLEDLAAYYASLSQSKAKADPEFLALGEKIYRGGNKDRSVTACIACHGPQGLGNEPAKFPRLSGQYAEYTVKQLHDYRSGKRTTDPNGIMRDIAIRMTDEEIEAVSSYVSGLH